MTDVYLTENNITSPLQQVREELLSQGAEGVSTLSIFGVYMTMTL